MRTRVAIIGAGPAGSAAAFHLACAGLDVTIIESRAFPRQKVCGEYISPAARTLLESLISPEELLGAGARRVPRIGLQVDEHHASWLAPAPAWSMSRERLDSLLLEKAKGAGAAICQPASVRDVRYTDEAATVNLADGRALDIELVIHADGHGRNDPVGPVPVVDSLIAHKCHLRIPTDEPAGDPHAVTMRACRGAYVGAIGIEGDLFTCALVARRDLTHSFQGNTDALLASLWPSFRRSWRISEWSSCGVPRSRYVRPGHPRSLRIGNAAAAVDPVGGEGIGLALWAANELAASGGVLKGLRRLNAAEQLDHLSRVERLLARRYTSQLRKRQPACQLAAWMLMRPALIRALWPTSAFPVLSLGPWYWLTGKPGADATTPSVAPSP